MLINPIAALIHNTAADKWHPVLFVESPLPGEDSANKPVRYKSKMHRTEGFATREEAEADCKANLAPNVPGLSSSSGRCSTGTARACRRLCISSNRRRLHPQTRRLRESVILAGPARRAGQPVGQKPDSGLQVYN